MTLKLLTELSNFKVKSKFRFQQFFRCSHSVFREKYSWIFCFTLSGVKMLEGFFRSHLFGKRVSRLKCQNVVLLCLGAVILFLSKEFHGLVSHFQEFRYQQVFSGNVFLFVRGFQGVKGLFYYIKAYYVQCFVMYSLIFCFTLSGVKMLEGFFRSHLFGKKVSRFKCHNVILLCLGAVILFLSEEIHRFVSHFQEFKYQKVFSFLSFCLLEGFKVPKVCFIILRCSLSVFIKGILWIFWFTFSGVQVLEFVMVLLSEVFKLSFCLSKIY